MKMEIIYEGPKKLKSLIENEYIKISNDYERKNPKIVIGLPPCNDSITLLKRGFKSRKDFNRFVDYQISRIQELCIKTRRRKNELKAKRQFLNAVDKLKKVSFVGIVDLEGTHAIYTPTIDAIILDARKAATQLITRDYNPGLDFEEKSAVYISNDLVHELVHYDNAECAYGRDLRKYLKPYYDIIKHSCLSSQAANKGVEAVRRWRLEQGGQEFLNFFENLRAQKSKDSTNLHAAFEEELNELIVDLNKVKDIIEDLGIKVAEESMAYNYSNDKESFIHWLKTDAPLKYKEKGLTLFDVFEKKIKSQGKLSTLREVKRTLDISYTQRKDVLSLFL